MKRLTANQIIMLLQINVGYDIDLKEAPVRQVDLTTLINIDLVKIGLENRQYLTEKGNILCNIIKSTTQLVLL